MENRNEQNAPASDPTERFLGYIGEQIFNRDLLCARCANLMDDTVAECEIYEQKPLPVLRGEDACPDFVPREQEEV